MYIFSNFNFDAFFFPPNIISCGVFMTSSGSPCVEEMKKVNAAFDDSKGQSKERRRRRRAGPLGSDEDSLTLYRQILG
jgi:hypothetical protein